VPVLTSAEARNLSQRIHTMANFTFIKLIDAKKTVPARLLPEKANGKYTWQIDDTDVLEYDPKTKQFSLEVYDFIDDDYQLVKTLGHDDAQAIALADGIIYQ
jgi:hypothetical protein